MPLSYHELLNSDRLSQLWTFCPIPNKKGSSGSHSRKWGLKGFLNISDHCLEDKQILLELQSQVACYLIFVEVCPADEAGPSKWRMPPQPPKQSSSQTLGSSWDGACDLEPDFETTKLTHRRQASSPMAMRVKLLASIPHNSELQQVVIYVDSTFKFVTEKWKKI